MAERIAALIHDVFFEHETVPGHPERSERLVAVRDALAAEGPGSVEWHSPLPAAREDVERIHDRRYVDLVEGLRGGSGWLDPDTAISPRSVEAAWCAAGAGVEAVRGLLEGDWSRALVLARPPGHHAERDRARGFCVFSNLAIAAAHARDVYELERILVVDWDVHHGNGTQHAFEADARVLFFDTHQHPLFPGSGALDETGVGSGAGYTVNLPLPRGMRDADLAHVYRELLVPIAEDYGPQLVLVSAGFDAHAADPIGGMALTSAGFAHLCSVVTAIAEGHCAGRLALFLEGGYDIAALGESVAACARVLAGEAASEPGGDAAGLTARMVLEARSLRERVLGGG